MRASVLIPTRHRPDYLGVALRSIAPQAAALGAEVVVVQDAAPDPRVEALARAHGARFVAHGMPRGLNATRNTAIEHARGELLAFVDDDVAAWPGWLAALLRAADAHPGHEAFGGPIRPRVEGLDLHWCGREDLPVTMLDHGREDRDVELAWGANLAIRRAAVDRVGGFDTTLEARAAHAPGAATTYGDEEDWLRRLTAAGGRVRYVAAAGVDHRRTGPDATWRALVRAAWFRGRAARRYDARKGAAPPLAAELRTVAGSAWHIARRRCGNGVLLTAMNAARLVEALRGRGETPAEVPDFLSGRSGTLSRRGAAVAAARDALADARMAPRVAVLRAGARRSPRRRVLAVCVARPERAATFAAARAELERSHHAVEIVVAEPRAGSGRWANLNAALADRRVDDRDWLLVFDDDVVLPRGFLDVFLLCAERLGFRMAQPAHAYRSHAAWAVTRRRPGVVARATRFVEQGPVLALDATAVEQLRPFPDLQMGWGIDAHWSAVAALRGWRIGVVDATPVRHLQPVAASYPHAAAVAEARAFLAGRPYVRRDTAAETVRAYRRLGAAA